MSGYRKALLWLATHVAAGVLGLQTAAAQCQNMGFGINQVCVELGACAYFKVCTQMVCYETPGCFNPVSVLECNWFGCNFVTSCSYFCG